MDAGAADLHSSFGFTQFIDIPTRVTKDTTSLIDLLFGRNTDNVKSHGTLPKIADHNAKAKSNKLGCTSVKLFVWLEFTMALSDFITKKRYEIFLSNLKRKV